MFLEKAISDQILENSCYQRPLIALIYDNESSMLGLSIANKNSNNPFICRLSVRNTAMTRSIAFLKIRFQDIRITLRSSIEKGGGHFPGLRKEGPRGGMNCI